MSEEKKDKVTQDQTQQDLKETPEQDQAAKHEEDAKKETKASNEEHKENKHKKHAEEMKRQMEALKKDNAELLKSLQMERADFDNFRKRNQTAVSEAVAAGKADAIIELLPVLDNFERAFQNAPEDSEDAFLKGMKMIYTQFNDTLKKMGVEEIPALNQPFDPNFHNAVMKAEPEEGEEEGIIKEVFTKGYTLKGKVIRYSMVKVIG